jgi:alcohol dehydrogenase class IV
MESLGFLQEAVNLLKEAGMESTIFKGVRPDPDVDIIVDGLTLYKESGADVIVAIGGGSAIDTAKGILYFAWKFQRDEGQDFKKPLFIAIPSTSGTGSEVTDFSVITTEGKKVCIADEFITPDIAILDSEIIRHVPKHVVADTGMDVLVHAIEAYVSTNATDFTDALAEKAIKLIFKNLPLLYYDTDNAAARDRVLNASCMAGMAFTNTGLGITHSLAHALGGTFHLSHGRSNAILMEAVIEYNSDLSGSASSLAAQKYAQLAALLQLPARTIREGVIHFIQAIRKLKKTLDIEDNIRETGVDKPLFTIALEGMSEAALHDICTTTNPRKSSKADLINILSKCYS